MTQIKKPIFAINFKAYDSAIGKRAVKLAKKIDKLSKSFQGSVILIVSNADLYAVRQSITEVYVFSEHIDPIPPGAHTGKIVAENIKDMGAEGVLINHAEDRITINNIEKSIQRARKNNLKTIVCAENIVKLRKIISLKIKPHIIAIEPPDLIGGKISVTKAKPQILERALEITKKHKIPLLCGAGIRTAQDVYIARSFGLDGILVASAITKSLFPTRTFKKLVKGFF